VRLSLSGRAIEVKSGETLPDFPPAKFIHLAREAGFEGVGIRSSQVTPRSSEEEISGLVRALRETGVGVASTFASSAEQKGARDVCALDYPETEPDYFDRFLAELKLAERLGAVVMRTPFYNVEQIRRACDLAAESPVKLVYANHTRSPFETVEGSLAALKKIDRPNFGLTLEPGNLGISGDDYGPAGIAKLKGYVFDVAIQNWVRVQSGGRVIRTNLAGEIRCEWLPLGDPRGLDVGKFFKGLKEIGYDGYVTVFEPGEEGRDARDFAREAARFYRQFI